MTVGELRETLQHCDPNQEILLQQEEGEDGGNVCSGAMDVKGYLILVWSDNYVDLSGDYDDDDFEEA